MNTRPCAPLNATPHRARRAQAGLSLVECLMTLCVACVAVGAVIPSFSLALEGRHLEGAAAQLETDIMHTRSLAVAADRSLRMRFQQDAAGSCYVVHSGPANACRCGDDGSAICSSEGQALRSVRYTADQRVELASNVTSILFSPTLGTSTPTGTLRFTGREGRALHVVVNITGRVRTCSPGATLAGYPAC